MNSDAKDETLMYYLGKVKGGFRSSHTLLTGGRYDVPDGDMKEFRGIVAEAIKNGKMPSMSEIHTDIFPFYLDLDLKVPVEKLGDETVLLIGQICNRQVKRCFVDVAEMQCIVCQRDGDSQLVPDTENYKHGLHLYWPELFVVKDDAYQLREVIIEGLDFEFWIDKLGVRRPDWAGIVDESVYSTGLRLVGTPKASKCKACTKASNWPCSVCNKRDGGYVMDPRKYELWGALKNDAVDERTTEYMRKNLCRVLEKTTVRCGGDVVAKTPGFKLYPGFRMMATSATKGRGRKRKADDADKLGRTAKAFEEDWRPEIHEVLRKILLYYSPHYERSRLSVRFNSVKKAWYVCLSGEGARYCANKGDFHNNQNVYMIVEWCQKSGNHVAKMCCWCRCDVLRTGGSTKGAPAKCADYQNSTKVLKIGESRLLFPKKSNVDEKKPMLR